MRLISPHCSLGNEAEAATAASQASSAAYFERIVRDGTYRGVAPATLTDEGPESTPEPGSRDHD